LFVILLIGTFEFFCFKFARALKFPIILNENKFENNYFKNHPISKYVRHGNSATDFILYKVSTRNINNLVVVAVSDLCREYPIVGIIYKVIASYVKLIKNKTFFFF